MRGARLSILGFQRRTASARREDPHLHAAEPAISERFEAEGGPGDMAWGIARHLDTSTFLFGDGDGEEQISQVARQERLIQQKATSLPSWGSLIGDPALARVGEYRTKEGGNQKIPDFAHVSHTQRRLEVGGAGW